MPIPPASLPVAPRRRNAGIDDAPLGYSDVAIVASAMVVVGGCLWPWSRVVGVALVGIGVTVWTGATRLSSMESGSVRSRARALGGAVVVFVAMGTWADLAKDGLDGPPVSFEAADAVVRSDPEPSIGGSRVDVSVGGRRWTMTVPAAMRGHSLRVGDRLVVSGSTASFPVRRAYHDARHLAGRIRLRSIHAHDAGGFPYREANAVRSLLLRSAAGFDDTQRTLFAGFVLGDVSSARPEMTDDFRASGLSHLVVVSGQNLAFLLAGVAPLSAVVGRRSLWVPAALRLIVVVGFVFVVRFEPSVLRAAFMASVIIFTKAIGRPQPLLRVLTVSVIGLLLVDPLLVRSVGFGLSVGAVAGIAAFAPTLTARFERAGRLAAPLAVTVGAQIGTAPIALLVFDGVPVVSVLANLVAMPIAAPIMSWGVLAGLPAGLLGPRASSIVHLPTRVLLDLVGAIARISASMPFGSITLVDVGIVGAVWLLARRVTKSGRVARWPVVLVVGVVSVVAPMLRVAGSAPGVVADSIPQPFGRGATVFGARHGVLTARANVLVLRHGVSSSAMLERLRRQRIGAVDLVVVESGGKPQVQVVRAVAHRVDVGMVVSAAGVGAPPGVAWVRALPGLRLRSGSVIVTVVDVRDRRLQLEVS